MPAKNILLINDDPSLLERLRTAIQASIVSIEDTSGLRQKLKHQVFPVVILETKKDWVKDLKRLLGNGMMSDDRCIIIGSSGLLKQTAEPLNEITIQVFEKHPPPAPPAHAKPLPQKTSTDLALEEFMEHRLKNFIKQMKTSGGRNLYSILLREIERPLLTITLKETNGNQIQAAHLLGMNRNTLRKKIKDYKIRILKNRHE